ncbi:hypothetical protein NE237_019268 [Protea cynaroides]|uniref:MACPF domain-containing protein n=1 Tax=Protea cynaroides TaxID=273540 RepID=A0A9Q0KBJ7_9MAGN|nr:hypothetical protein NE237_019268 [Protea cynaroides]
MVTALNERDAAVAAKAEMEALGSFNSVFSFTGSKQIDAASSKSLAVDGFFISLCEVQLMKSPLVLQGKVKQAIPSSWDPSALARFIENFGTHVITSVTIGGKDVIYIKQHHSLPLSNMEIKKYVKDIGDQRFSDTGSHASSGPMKFKDNKGVDPGLFNSQGIYPQPPSAPYLAGKEVWNYLYIFKKYTFHNALQFTSLEYIGLYIRSQWFFH